jgi:hypothetical protein
MAQAPESPPGGELLPGLSAAVAPAGPAPGPVPPEAKKAEEPYKPLSLLAVAGFALAVLYALLVALGGLAAFYVRHRLLLLALVVLAPLAGLLAGLAMKVKKERLGTLAGLCLAGFLGVLGMASLVAYSGSSPWLMPGWTLLLPLAAAGISWLARVQIRRSEGTLAGRTLTGWGLGLSLVFGLNYAAYSASTFFAVRHQAGTFADQWIRDIVEGRPGKAFLATQPPGTRRSLEGLSEEALRDSLEQQFNAPTGGPTSMGAWSTFTQAPHVRLLSSSGEGTTFRLRSASPPELAKKVYRVTLLYDVQLTIGECQLQVVLEGTEAPGQAGRQWTVVFQRTGSLQPTFHPNEKGRRLIAAGQSAGPFVREWAEKLRRGHLDEAFLETLPAREQARGERRAAPYRSAALAAGLVGRLPLDDLAGAAAAGALAARRRAFLQGAETTEGGVLSVKKEGPRKFWAHSDFKKEILALVKSSFDPAAASHPNLELRVQDLPAWEWDGDLIRLRFTGRMLLADPTSKRPRYLAEGAVVVEGRSSDEGPPKRWRIRALELIRGQSFTAPAGRPGDPRLEALP